METAKRTIYRPENQRPRMVCLREIDERNGPSCGDTQPLGAI